MRTYSSDTDAIISSVNSTSVTINDNIVPRIDALQTELEDVKKNANKLTAELETEKKNSLRNVRDITHSNELLKAAVRTNQNTTAEKIKTLFAAVNTKASSEELQKSQKDIKKLQNYVVALSLLVLIEMLGLFILTIPFFHG